MIPHRVKLAGFLSYKEEQEVCFDGAPVWLLSGANGSGKSSIFDALTYALFGSHRGGTSNAVELVNKDSTSLSVAFDFRLDGEMYRIKRTLRRTNKGSSGATQQVYHATNSGPDGWLAVPDTNKKVNFDSWIHDHIGLNYDTFTSSVLLLQGRAEKLLDSKPSGRAEVLAGIVDVERYQKLYDLANSQKLGLKGQLDVLEHQIEGLTDISEMEFQVSLTAIDNCEDARIAAVKEIDKFSMLEHEARRWSEAETRLETARKKLVEADALLGEAVAIETAHTRLTELEDVLPAAHTVVTTRGQSNDSGRKVERLQRERIEAEERKRAAEKAFDDVRRQRTLHQKQRDQDETTLQQANARLRTLSAQLQTAAVVERQQADLARLTEDLVKQPEDPDALLRIAQENRDRLETLQRVLPSLERLQIERQELAAKVLAQQEATRQLEATEKEGKKLKSSQAKSSKELVTAREFLTTAEQELAVATNVLELAQQAAKEFAKLGSAKKCRACGQKLTATHFAEENATREKEVTEAERRLEAATTAKQGAEKEHAAKAAADKEQLDTLHKRRDDYTHHKAAAANAVSEMQRLIAALNLRFTELPEPFRLEIAVSLPQDWAATTFPDGPSLDGLRREVAGVDVAKRAVREAEAVLAKVRDLRSQFDAGKRALEASQGTLPAEDLAALRQEYTTLHAQETTLTTNINSVKKVIVKADSDVDRHSHDSHTASQHLTEIAGKLQTEAVNQTHCKDTIDRELTGLSAIWRPLVEAAGLADYSVWKDEYDALLTAGTQAKFKQLEVARHGLDAIRREIARCQSDTEAFSPEARRSPDEVRGLLLTARQSLTDRDKDLQAAHKHRDQLANLREQRAKLTVNQVSLQGQHSRYKLLAELLGRDRLQRHLVRQAERQIVDYGNAVLDRLSGGQLFLQLVGADDDTPQTGEKALDMECYNRVTGGTPINVTFLSGSQRFRVAVSLALAIGQYASRQHRPIESVIIDEGFGCLDRQGRQVMIQELLNLRGHLQCILLVSHQEEFADAFNHGYRFELCNGATHVSRMLR